jgi:hypothetical protein
LLRELVKILEKEQRSACCARRCDRPTHRRARGTRPRRHAGKPVIEVSLSETKVTDAGLKELPSDVLRNPLAQVGTWEPGYFSLLLQLSVFAGGSHGSRGGQQIRSSCLLARSCTSPLWYRVAPQPTGRMELVQIPIRRHGSYVLPVHRLSATRPLPSCRLALAARLRSSGRSRSNLPAHRRLTHPAKCAILECARLDPLPGTSQRTSLARISRPAHRAPGT